MNTLSRGVRLSIAVTCSVAFASGCSEGKSQDAEAELPDATPTPITLGDGPVYESVEELVARGELIVRGIVGATVATELDGGGATPEDSSNAVPIKFVELAVSESSDEAVVALGDVAVVAWDDYAGVTSGGEDHPDLVAGAEVLLVVVDKTSKEAPGIQSFDRFLVPVGGSAGVFDIVDGNAVARSAEVVALSRSNARSSDGNVPLTSSVDTIVNFAQRAWAKE
ncbi:hypothetical protein [Nocardioides sp. TF02-7]|uniref:hypothetical protein n=1 Tax=Nocardioides sp. TF02-7 TaxID=2917724 RepID=UPI001F054A67|nr:hypothetical protein [Nocardioides sp. TF02-7]UMG91141.1 hypothetical protein MF408_13130 [Nocardioides sp. TF02-7]